MSRRISRLVVVLAGSVLAFASGMAAADAREVEASLGMGVHKVGSPSLDASSTSDLLTLVGLGLAVRVGPELPILGPIYVEAQISNGMQEADDFHQIDTVLVVTSLQVGVCSSRPIRRWLRTFARGDLGLVWGGLTLSGAGSRTAITDTDRSMTAYGAVGLEATLYQKGPEARDFSFGVRIELGYLAARDLSFSAKPDYPDDDLNRIETASAPLGSADLSGPALHLDLVGRW